MKPSDLRIFLQTAFKQKWPVLVTSSPGCGKTDIISQAVEDVGYDLIVSHPVVSDPTDYKGMPYVSPKGDARFVPFNDLKVLIDTTKPTVFFIDDLGQAPSSVQAAVMQLLLARRINDHKVSDHVVFVAATNRKQDRAGVSGILEPVKSRFYTILALTPDTADWVDWALQHDMPPELIAYIRWRESTKGGILYDFKATADMTNSPCPRTVAFLGNMMTAGIPESTRMEAFKGAVGEGMASEFLGFLQIYKDLPDPIEVIAHPLEAKMPPKSRPDILFALCSSLAAKTTDKNFGNVITFSERKDLPIEFGLMLVQDCATANPKLCDTAAFTKWSTKHLDLLP